MPPGRDKTSKKQPEGLKLTKPHFQVEDDTDDDSEEEESGSSDGSDDESDDGTASQSSTASNKKQSAPPQSGIFGFIQNNIRMIVLALFTIIIIGVAIWFFSIRAPQRAVDIHNERENIDIPPPPDPSKQPRLADPPVDYNADEQADRDLERIQNLRAQREAEMRDTTERLNEMAKAREPQQQAPPPQPEPQVHEPQQQAPPSQPEPQYQPPPKKVVSFMDPPPPQQYQDSSRIVEIGDDETIPTDDMMMSLLNE